MASVINTNVASLNAQRNLNSSQTALATSLQRLSSGLRINSAKDDAAGLAISDRFTTQIRGLNQASRNANDAISLSQTAEGALGEVTSNLQRIRELAVQSANATNSASDRAALDLEVQQRLSEIDRISSQTSFNGQKILDGTFGQAAFQVGANVGETITLDLSTSMRPNSIGQLAEVTTAFNLNSLASDVPTPAVYNSAPITPFDFSSVPAELGTSTVAVTTAALAGDSIDINGVTFTFAEGVAAISVDSATSVTITGDIGNTPLNATTTASQLDAAIDAYIADGVSADARLDDITPSNGTGTLTLTYATAGLPSDNNTISIGAGSTLAATIAVDATGSNIGEDIVVGTTTVNLSTNITSADDLVSVINAALIAAGDTTVIASAGPDDSLILTTSATGTAVAIPTPVPTIGDPNAVDLIGATNATTSHAGLDAATLDIAAGDFSIQLGDSTPVSVSGQFTSAQSIVDAVNRALAGNATAQLNDDGTMSIFSDEDVVITGDAGLTTLGLDALTEADGNLIGGNILDVAASNDIIRRLDSALTSISDLRSTFGAIQNRFESTISNLGTAVENLSAARSRIMDADFAAETAALTRAQILQQAGTAMLSQANAIPQNVLSLLQG